MTSSIVRDFTYAWDHTRGDDFASRLARQSLIASTQGIPELESVLMELEKPYQERLDLRITGEGVVGHSTAADALAALYGEFSAAVSAIAKALTGKGRWTPQLLASAAAPGSVKVRLEVPRGLDQDAIPGTEGPLVESQALRSISNLIAQAEPEGPDDMLASSTSELPAKARSALRRLAKAAVKAEWEIESTLEARGRETVSAKLTSQSARRIIQATEARTIERTPVEFSGVGDGWAWSTGTLRFIPDHGRPFSASVPPHLQHDAAKLVAWPDTRVKAKFNQVKIHPSGSKQTTSTTYSLISVEVLQD